MPKKPPFPPKKKGEKNAKDKMSPADKKKMYMKKKKGAK